MVWGLTGPLGDGTGPRMPDVPHNGHTQGRKHSTFCQLESAFSGQGKFKIQHRRHILAECPCPAERRVVSWPRREGSSTEDQRTQSPSAAKRGNQGSFLPVDCDEPSPTLQVDSHQGIS